MRRLDLKPEERMQARPVLMLTHDDLLWQQWKRVPVVEWLPARGRSWDDLLRWQAHGRRLAVVDSGLPGLPPLDDTEWLGAVGDGDLLIASVRPNDEEGRRFLAAGAKGYVHGYVPPETIATALKVIANGGVWMGANLLTRLLRQLDRGAAVTSSEVVDWAKPLTPREKEVAHRAALGMSNQSIADTMNITERTVRAHISSVFEKLAVSDRLMLALKVHGIIS